MDLGVAQASNRMCAAVLLEQNFTRGPSKQNSVQHSRLMFSLPAVLVSYANYPL